MNWKKLAYLVGIGLLVVGFSLPVSANDETDEVEIKVQATLDAVDCTAMSITVLGLAIDISKASINSNMDNEGNEDIEENEDDDSGDLTCGDLVVGQVVEVKLASDILDPTTLLLPATQVDIGGGECEDTVCDEVEIAAPLQVIDLSGPSVTVLGLVVDISKANLEGCDDEDSEDNDQPIDVSQLIQGQFVEITLASNQAPLVATELEVKNISNEVDVEVVDEEGDDVDDDLDDVEVDVQVTTKVKASPAAAFRRVKKVLSFHTATNGRFRLAGLPTGRAKIVVTRVNNGQTTSAIRKVKVTGNRTKYLRMRLKSVH